MKFSTREKRMAEEIFNVCENEFRREIRALKKGRKTEKEREGEKLKGKVRN